jgi:hypothetical protein
MTRLQAIEAIRASVAQGTGTPIFEPDRDAAVVKLAQELESASIEPVPAVIGGIAYPDVGLAEALAADSPLVIARAGDNWLGFLPSRKEFFWRMVRRPLSSTHSASTRRTLWLSGAVRVGAHYMAELAPNNSFKPMPLRGTA